MDKYIKIISFDVGTEMPTHEYVEHLEAQNARLTRVIQVAKPWIAKCAADHDTDYLGLRASKVLELVTETIRKAGL